MKTFYKGLFLNFNCKSICLKGLLCNEYVMCLKSLGRADQTQFKMADPYFDDVKK